MSWLGYLAALFSDRDDKTDIKRLGSDPETGVPLYAYRYKDDPKSYPKVVGPMADDLRKAGAPVREIGGHEVVGLASGGVAASGPPTFQAGGTGLVPGAGAGRADTVRTSARRGSYVLPADVVSAAGEGNTLAGAAVIAKRLAPSAKPQGGMPEADHMEVAFSGGEYVIAPEQVAALGGGDPAAGAERLDRFVQTLRAAGQRAVARMPPPK